MRFQNWGNIIAHNVMLMKKRGSTSNCNDLRKLLRKHTKVLIRNDTPGAQIDKTTLTASWKAEK